MHDTISTPRAKGGLLPLLTPSKETKRQIDIGDYTIFAGKAQVGEVYVEASPGHTNDPAHTIEHWCLYADYEAPSPEHKSVAIELRYRGAYMTTSAFLEHAVTLDSVRYIRAVCDQISPAEALRTSRGG